MKSFSWLTVSALALAHAGAAQAQTGGDAQDAGPRETSDADVIVVTAERRSTSLQETGVAATVLTNDDLVKKSVTDVVGLQFATPSLTVNTTGQGNAFNIRGVGKTEQTSAIGVGVITYRDGVATLPGYFQLEPYYDIASVEVLRGPQGTFAGANATGGAVFISSENPSFDGVEGYALAQYGNYDHMKVQGAVNVPLSDTLAIRLAGNAEQRDSFYTVLGPWTGNPGDRRDFSGRASLNWAPTDKFRVLVKADYNNIEYGGLPASNALETGDPLVVSNNAHLDGRDEFTRVVANASYEFDGGVTLRSITGYQYGTTQIDYDSDGTADEGTLAAPAIAFNDYIHEEIWSQEINLISPDEGPFTWVLGGFWQDDEITIPEGGYFVDNTPNLFPVSIDVALEGTNPKTAQAYFGQVGYELTDSLQLQVGARWSRTTSRNDAISSTPQYPPLVLEQHDITADETINGKVALNWTVNPNHFLYAFVATGSKAGGLNGPNLAFVPPLPFEAEEVTDYELGWKGALLDRRLRTQLGAYYNQYENFQVNIVDPRAPSISSIVNVPGETELYGLEFSAQGSFGAAAFDFSGSLSNSSIGAFFAADPRLGAPAAACDPATGPEGPGCFDLTGNEQTYAPKFTFNAGAQYEFLLSQDMTLTPRVDVSHIDAVWGKLFQNVALGDRIEARDIVNAQLTLETGPWSVAAYGTNITDEHYVAAINGSRRLAGAPAQYGVRLHRTF